MIVGFTGTRDGMTSQQRLSLLNWVRECRPDGCGMGYVDEFHHGCCVGADAQSLQVLMFMPRVLTVVGHPPDNKSMISSVAVEKCCRLEKPRPYLDRNRDIVDASEI
jgi:hypothetical protein